jgi:hypothetical protein
MSTDGGVMVCQESKCTEYGKMYNFILKLKQQGIYLNLWIPIFMVCGKNEF